MCLALTGCGGGEVPGKNSGAGKPGATAAPSLAAADVPFYTCMQQHGMTVSYGENGAPHIVEKESPQYPEAQKACLSLLPSPSPVQASPQELAAARKSSACMRERGISWYPDPNPVTGEVQQQDGGTSEQWQSLKKDHLDAYRTCLPRPS
ncbi:hypothetical protein [Streptomyces sp. NPDC002082]|uniref:hypothetical protein n=1 Tax=Streptomyces sp. NPDC002082 TaxID=3154772 RepID=UPI003320A2E7